MNAMLAAPKVPHRQVLVGVAAMAVTSEPGETLITYALGSCVAVIVYDPLRRAGGLLHFMLPRSALSPGKAKSTPAMFADTGVPALFHRLYAVGCVKGAMVVKVAGGGSLLQGKDAFDIGRSNSDVLVPMFKKAGVTVSAWDVGGTSSRTVELCIDTGEVIVRSRGTERKL